MSLLEINPTRSDVAAAVDPGVVAGSRVTGPCTSGAAGDAVFRLASRLRQQITPQRTCISARLERRSGGLRLSYRR
jgi:hypothetical protein